MFSSGPNFNKLKTNLRLALNRLKLIEKKKTEMAQKARKEIADFLAVNKVERARIRVEHIIREDYYVEAMEIVEMYCDLVLARFGLITQMKELDAGIAEAVHSLIWVAPRLQSDIPEMAVISDILCKKYGQLVANEDHVPEKLQNKLKLQEPPKLLVEKYLVEIAKIYQIDYVADPLVMENEQKPEFHLIELSDSNNLDGGGGASAAPPQMGFIGYPTVPPLPQMYDNNPSTKLFNYPPQFGGAVGAPQSTQPLGPAHTTNNQFMSYNADDTSPSAPSLGLQFNIPLTNIAQQRQPTMQSNDLNKESKDPTIVSGTHTDSIKDSSTNSTHNQQILRLQMPHDDPPPRYSSINPMNLQGSNLPKAEPRMKIPPAPKFQPEPDADLALPTVPNDQPEATEGDNGSDNEELDFDILRRRFAELKKRD